MVDGGSDPRWYVVYTKSKQEERAESNLRAWGVETVLPRLCERRGARVLTAPLFPRYLFARFDAGRLLAKVRHTRGVHDVVAFGEQATPVDDSLVAVVRARIAADGFVRIADLRP